MNLGFLGANDLYWNVRYETAPLASLRVPVLVCYKSSEADPQGHVAGISTVRFRDYPNYWPENGIMGVMTSRGLTVANWPSDLVVADGSDPLFDRTGLTSGQHIPRLLGWEGDRIMLNGVTPSGVRLLFHSPYQSASPNSLSDVLDGVYYVWPSSGARVFASGNVGFQWALATYGGKTEVPQLGVLLENILADFATERDQH
jgi:hypothetical protein